MNVLAIIPARGGSKRLPRKNLQKVGDLTLVQHAVAHARACPEVTQVVVSTDDDEIADSARGGLAGIDGGWWPPDILMRPPELATDDASSWDVVAHALDKYPDAEVFVLLQPTSPLRTPEDITRCVRHTDDGSMAYTTHVGRHLVVSDYTHDHDRPNGAVYAQRVDAFRQRSAFGRVQVLMPKARSIDIDTAEDLKEARRAWNRTRQDGTPRGT